MVGEKVYLSAPGSSVLLLVSMEHRGFFSELSRAFTAVMIMGRAGKSLIPLPTLLRG